MTDLKPRLDSLYRRFNRRAYVHPDPLEMVYRYEKPEDQEIAGLVSAALAYGRVSQILASVSRVLGLMSPGGPRAWLEAASEAAVRRRCAGFRHRFTSEQEMAGLLVAVKRAIAEHGSLVALFEAGTSAEDETVLPALTVFVDRLRAFAGSADACPSLLSSPADGSACKRLNLYLRWMVRKDAVDPGPWRGVPPGHLGSGRISAAKLVVPLDTHMYRIGSGLGFTSRKQANLATALEMTRALARYSPRDPVRYDFSLTRLGINPACRDEDIECILKGKE